MPPNERTRLSEGAGGLTAAARRRAIGKKPLQPVPAHVYCLQRAVSPPRIHTYTTPTPNTHTEADLQLVEYYKHTAEKGDVGAMVQLGKLYYHGSQGVRQSPVRCWLVDFGGGAGAGR